MKLEAIFSDETQEYVYPEETEIGDRVSVRIKTLKNDVDRAFVICEDEIIPMEKLDFELRKESYFDNHRRMKQFDFYEAKLIQKNKNLSYYFKLVSKGEEYFYNRIGIKDYLVPEYNFNIIAGFKIPMWAKGAIIYQIFIDRFFREDGHNTGVCDGEYVYIGRTVKGISEWESGVENFDVHRFYGGNLQGVYAKIDYLKSIGVNAIYFNPLFVSPSNHKYDVQDYDYIDPHLTGIVKDNDDYEYIGNFTHKYIERTTNKENLEQSNKIFADFVNYAHSKGIKIILDGVFNHCSSYHKWMDKSKIYQYATEKGLGEYKVGAYNDVKSPYRNYFKFHNNFEYDGWWGHDTLPKLNYEQDEALVEEIMSIAKKWVSPPYNVDGWRLDVAADLGHTPEFNHKFWKRFRKEVKEANPEAIIIAEHYGSAKDWLGGDEWDTVMNYDAFMEPITWFLTGIEKHSDRADHSLAGNGRAFYDTLCYAKANMPMQSYMCAMNELSNHDHSRFLTRTNGIVGRIDTVGAGAASTNINMSVFRQAILMQLTLQGCPTLYYGDEAGLCGFTDPDSRRCFPWKNQNYELVEYYRYLNLVHNSNEVLQFGSMIPLIMSDSIVCYERVYKEKKAIVVIYTGMNDTNITIDLELAGRIDDEKVCRVLYSDNSIYNLGKQTYRIIDNKLNLYLRPKSALLFLI